MDTYLVLPTFHVQSSWHLYVAASSMIDAMIVYCYIRTMYVGIFVWSIAYSSWACTLSASNINIPHNYVSYIHTINPTSHHYILDYVNKKYFKFFIHSGSINYCEKPHAHYGINTSSMRVCGEQMCVIKCFKHAWSQICSFSLFQRSFSNCWVCNVVHHTKGYIWNIACFFIDHFLSHLSVGWLLTYCLFLFTGSYCLKT